MRSSCKTSAGRAACMFLIVALLADVSSATYIPWNGRRSPGGDVASIAAGQKSNSVGHEEDPSSTDERRPHKSVFRNDADVYRYLKGTGRQLMIWKCRNAIQSYWHYKPLPFIDLYCDVIGTMKTVAWSHRGRKIAGTGVELAETDVSRYSYSIETHHDSGQYYSAWLDFRLRILNATQKDSGIYRFRVTSPTGDSDHRLVYVDISDPPTTTTPAPTTISTSGPDPELLPAEPERRRQSHKWSRRRRLKMRRRRRKKLERRQRRGGPSISSSASIVEV